MRNILNIKLVNILTFTSILCVFLSIPYIFFYIFGPFYILVSSALIGLLFALAIHYYIQLNLKLSREDILWLAAWFIYVGGFALYSIFTLILYDDLYEFRKSMGFFIKFIFILTLVIIVKNNYWNYSKFVLNINIIIIFLSVILFFILAFGIDFPRFTFVKLDSRYHSVFWIGATNAVFSFGGHSLIRIAGFADEPGSLALIITYLIVINEMTLRSVRLRIMLIIGGLLSFSLAFVLTLFVFVIYWLLKGMLGLRSFLWILVIVLALLGLSQSKNVEPIVKMVSVFGERFEKGEGGKYKGDNRSISIPVQIKAFKEQPLFGVGIAPENMKKIEAGNPSFTSYLALHGIWGMIFLDMPVYLLIALNINKKEFFLILALLLNYLQRPGIEDLFSMMALTLIFYSTLYYKKHLC